MTREGKTKLLDGSSIHTTLSNPEIPLDVGTHLIKVKLPTVLEDFFDLPLIQIIYRFSGLEIRLTHYMDVKIKT